MLSRFYTYLFFLLLLFSCGSAEKPEQTRVKTIYLQPYSDLPKAYLDFVCKGLKKIYPMVGLRDPIPLPSSAFYPSRNRYRADSLIRMLSAQTAMDAFTIGLTTKDISTTNGEIRDWGVMGLGYCPGHACVASSFRLQKDKKVSQLFKVAVHELGHTQGLQHCPVTNCYMRDAEGKNHTDEENGFCEKCRAVLLEKGWKFQN